MRKQYWKEKKGNDMKRLLCTAAFAAAVLSVEALDNTIHNSFWDTRAYVNPSPSVSRSAGSATATFDLSGRSRRIATPLAKAFSSRKPGAFILTIR